MNSSQLNIQSASSDVIHNIMKFMDIPELKNTSITCKNLKSDSETFSQKIKKTENLQKLVDDHTCKFCLSTGYDISRDLCNECYMHMCENCFQIRNHMNEFTKIPVNDEDICYGYMKICHDYCVFRCHECKFFDDRHQLFLIDNVNFKTLCVSCFDKVNKDEQKLYETPKQHPSDYDDWDYGHYY